MDADSIRDLARRVRAAQHELAEAAVVARSLGLPTYLQAPLATATLKADMAASGLERANVDAGTEDAEGGPE